MLTQITCIEVNTRISAKKEKSVITTNTSRITNLLTSATDNKAATNSHHDVS